MIRNEQKANQLFIFKRVRDLKFLLYKRIVVKELQIINKVCMSFYFENPGEDGQDPQALIFVKQDRIIRLDFNSNKIETIMEFKHPMKKQPEYFIMNNDQSILVIASDNDGIYIDL